MASLRAAFERLTRLMKGEVQDVVPPTVCLKASDACHELAT